MAKKHRPGRRVYYKPFSHNKSRKSLLDAREMKREAFRRALALSPASVEARLISESRTEDAVYKTLKLQKPQLGDPYLEAQAEFQRLSRLADYDQHVVLLRGLKTVRILFQNKEGTAFWIIERNMFTGRLKRSVDYGSREQAMQHNDADCIVFALVDYVQE